jgi:DNA-binding MurR/RpiR family transcriptional regulator
MEAFEGFGRRLENRFDGLTASQKRMASYLLAGHDEAAFLPAAALARRIDVSEATVVRFARAIGYSGFPEPQPRLRAVSPRPSPACSCRAWKIATPRR